VLPFVVLELGCLLVAAGWALEGRRFSAWFNAGAAGGFAVAWVVIGRVRRRREAASAGAGTVGS
jgi:hypothetical protein